jgi:hypothetical protein
MTKNKQNLLGVDTLKKVSNVSNLWWHAELLLLVIKK